MADEVQACFPGVAEVRAQLGLILQSQGFSSSEKLKEFLEYVVEETLAGRGEQIKAYTIGLEVFGLGQNFDPSLNTVVRVTAGRVRDRLERYYYKAGAADKVYIDIPRGNYAPFFSYLNRRASIPAPAEHSGAELAERETKRGLKQYKPTILVMPFSEISNDKSLAPFLKGLAEEIAIALNRYDEFVVYTPQSLKEQSGDVWQLAERTGAKFIINGSAQLHDHKLRLRVALIDSQTRFHIWADKFEGDLNARPLFDIQDDITAQFVSRIADSFSFVNRIQLKREIVNSDFGLEVYEAMLLYHYWVISLTPEHYTKARVALEKAVRLEPQSAPLKAMLADVYAANCQWGIDLDKNDLELSLKLADEALEIDDCSHYANWAKAYNYFLRRDKDNFLHYVNKSLALNPSNTNIMATSAVKLIMTGEVDKGFEMLREALRFNPHIPSWYRSGMFIIHYLKGNFEEALSEAQHITTPNFFWGPLMRAAANGQLGKIEDAQKELTELFRLVPDFVDSGRGIMLKLFFQEKSVEKLIQGLKLAGLDIKDI